MKDFQDNKIIPKELEDFILKENQKPGNLITILHKVQDHFKYIPRKAIFEIAQLTAIPVAKIYGIITFYNNFKLEMPGENQIEVCTGTACYLKGSQNILDELEKQLKVKENEITKDGAFSYRSVRCLGCCGQAPVISVNGKIYGNVTFAKITKILHSFCNEERKSL